MYRTTMGSSDKIGASEAAKILGVSQRSVNRYTQEGRLRPVGHSMGERNPHPVYAREEVEALAESRSREMSFAELQEVVLTTRAVADETRNRVHVFEQVTGLHVPPLPCDAHSVRELHERLEMDLESPVIDQYLIDFWAEKFFGKQIHLELFVKVDKDWRKDDKKLKKYGYES